MKTDKLQDAIGLVDDDLVVRAAKQPRKINRWARWIAPVAAVLAVAIALGVFLGQGSPLVVSAYAVAEAQYPQSAPYPVEPTDWGDKSADDLFSQQYKAWREEQKLRREQATVENALDPFFAATMAEFLQDDAGENRVYSPLNLYMALAMLAETADGESREQILALLGADSIDALRQQAGAVWRANYQNDGATTSILANSLWMNQDADYNAKTVERLAETYYASSFRGEMGSGEYSRALRDWLNAQTGGLLADAVDGVELSPETVLALASTIYYRAKWEDEFWEDETETGVFYAESGEIECDFMHQELFYNPYYWGERFTAVSKWLSDGGQMWLILPDEGVELQTLLADQEVWQFVTANGEWANRQDVRVNLAMPKFDVSGRQDLCEGLKRLGVTDCFDASAADFSPLMDDAEGIFVSAIDHAARVTVDEEGVTAAAFTEIALAGGAAAPSDEVDFTLDRPFLFVITGINGTPLFAGTVCEP